MELQEILRMERQREKQEDISAPEQVSILLCNIKILLHNICHA